MRRRPAAILLILASACAGEAAAQCPDGTPPPCQAQRRAAARRAPPPPAQRARQFMVLPFRNVTRAEAQEWLVVGGPLMLGEALGQFRELTVVPEAQLLAARRRLGLTADAPDAAQLRLLATETGGWTGVSGTIIASGGRLRIGVQAVDAVSGDVLARAEADAPVEADVRPLFDRLVVRLLEPAGLPPQTSDVAAASTRSLDAYRAFVRGVTLLQQSAFARSRQEFTEAVRLDSTFAMAWARLALAGAAWNMAELANPFSMSYAAANRAAALAPRLPPREAARVRVLAMFFGGRLGAAIALGDSLARTDPDDLDAREFLALCRIIDPVLAAGDPARPRADFNRGIRMAVETVEQDPGRRYVYGVIGFVYAMAGGWWFGEVPTVRGEGPSFAATVMAPTVARFVPVLRDSFEMVPRAVFDSLPPDEQRRLRRHAVDAGLQWMQRWVAAGPDDADAYLWRSRLVELQGDLPGALRETEAALARGVESPFEFGPGRRVQLLVRLGRVAEAAALADSLLTAGAWRRPMLPNMDRGWSFGVGALLMNRQFARAVELASLFHRAPAGEARCAQLWEFLDPGAPPGLPPEVARAAADSALTHGAAAPELAPCRDGLRRAAGRGAN